ncbi:MAG: DUF5658 family protein [Deferrisomatales bacterium]|nr:DUF5658 family protein [Deferrisomatales bacterium]
MAERENAARVVEERRRGERRTERGYRFVDRRSGFDRRTGTTAGRASPLGALVEALRAHPGRFALLLVGINTLNLADYLLTLVALANGVGEANPFMAGLFEQSSALAGFVKVALVGLVSALLWRVRTFRLSIVSAALMLGLLFGVFGFHLAGLSALR